MGRPITEGGLHPFLVSIRGRQDAFLNPNFREIRPLATASWHGECTDNHSPHQHPWAVYLKPSDLEFTQDFWPQKKGIFNLQVLIDLDNSAAGRASLYIQASSSSGHCLLSVTAALSHRLFLLHYKPAKNLKSSSFFTTFDPADHSLGPPA